MPDPLLLIIGASGRAAAASAIRAGFEPFVIDLFADADTVRLCPTLKCDLADYPHGFIELARRAPPGPWMYTGGLENYPDVVGTISEMRPLWGNGPDVLRRVRDPWFLDALPRHVVGFAEVVPRRSDHRLSFRPHLRKPLRGAGGGGIRAATADDRPDDPNVYFQELVEGEPESAVFASVHRVPITLGCTLQLIGTPWLHAGRFQYAGNVTRPWERYPVASFDADLCQASGLSGLFGLDFIDRWVVDVNPRYTASVEVLEFAHGVPMLECDTSPPQICHTVGKAIYYAAKSITFPASGPWDESLRRCTDVWQMPHYADIPHAGSVIDFGQPVFTLFASATTEAECVNQLKAKAAACDRLFGVPTPEGES